MLLLAKGILPVLRGSMLKTLFSLIAACSPAFCGSGGNLPSPPVTVLIDFDQPHSARSVAAMERETAHILGASGIRLEWQMMKDLAPNAEFSDFVVVRFRGSCATNDVPMPMDERGVLGLSYASDGEVLPFGEVQCDRVKQSVRRVVSASRFRVSEDLLGQALGRVLAHEMYHMLANDRHHTENGVMRQSLTANDLVAGELLYSDRATQTVSRRKGAN
jgi:hypothetical protein